MQIAVHAAGELEARAASALASHPAVERLGVIGRSPSTSWGERVRQVDDPTGFEVVVGAGGREAARATGAILVVPGPAPDDGPAVTYASPTGLARALAASLPPGAVPSRTVPGDPGTGSRRAGFPAPVGWLPISGENEGVGTAGSRGPLGAVIAELDGITLGVVDEVLYLAAATLAAGAFVAHHSLTGPAPVWDHGSEYLAACQGLGLVIAEGVTPDGS